MHIYDADAPGLLARATDSCARKYRLAFYSFGMTSVQVCDVPPSVWHNRVEFLHRFWAEDDRVWQLRFRSPCTWRHRH